MSIKLLIGSETNKEWLELPCDNGKIVRFLHDHEPIRSDNCLYYNSNCTPTLWDYEGFPFEDSKYPIDQIRKKENIYLQDVDLWRNYGHITTKTILDLNLLAKVIEEKPKESLMVVDMVSAYEGYLTLVKIMNWIVQVEEDDFTCWDNGVCPDDDYEFCQQILKSFGETVESVRKTDPRISTITYFREDLEEYFFATKKGFFSLNFVDNLFSRRQFVKYFETKQLFANSALKVAECPFSYKKPCEAQHCQECLSCGKCHLKCFLNNL